MIYYNTYDREYDERGIIDIYESNVIGAKYNFSNNFNDEISFGFGSEYKYEWGYFDNNGSYSASTKGNIDNLAILEILVGNFLKQQIFLFSQDKINMN